MISQIRLLQLRAPFETFSIELANGRVLQIHDRHSVATTDGTRRGEAVIGVLHASGAFEVINASQVISASGCIPRSSNSWPTGWSGSRKRLAVKGKKLRD